MNKAAIFDFDGTLADSFTPRKLAHTEVASYLINYLRSWGHDPGPERALWAIQRLETEMNARRVFDRNQWWEILVKTYRSTPFKEEVLEHATRLYWDTIRDNSAVYKGVPEMLAQLTDRGILLGLLTDTDGLPGSKQKRIEASGLTDYFASVVIAGEDTNLTKPSTEPFEKACAELDVEPDNCVYVCDDSETDLPGAETLGMQTLLMIEVLKHDASGLAVMIATLLDA
ncbi:HAD family hydrolase [candidate division WOR-3 bacterium]|nr:HAD family hydrolase [candidate division WOR-3 bacterium]